MTPSHVKGNEYTDNTDTLHVQNIFYIHVKAQVLEYYENN